VNSDRLRQYDADPIAFADDVLIRTKDGMRRFGDIKVPIQQELLQSLAPSLIAVRNGDLPPIPRVWAEMTKGYAKTLVIAICVVWLVAFSRRRLRIQIAAADKDQAAETRFAAMSVMEGFDGLEKRVRIDKWQINCEETGSQADIIAADEAGSHGALPDVLFIDEITAITKENFVLNLLDNAEKNSCSLVGAFTNAGFTGSWQYRLREIACTSPGRWAFHQATAPAPFHSPASIEDARRRDPSSRFHRLWYGVWSSPSGDALDPEDVAAAVTIEGPMETRRSGWIFAGGFDLGWKNDHSAFAIVARNIASQRFRLVQLISWAPGRNGEVDLQKVEDEIVRANETFRMATVAFDPHQAALMAQRLKKRGVRVTEVPFVGGHLTEMASTLLETFRARTIDLYRDELLLKELSRLVIIENRFGFKLESTRGVDGHCDRATALTLALLAARDAKPRREVLVA